MITPQVIIIGIAILVVGVVVGAFVMVRISWAVAGLVGRRWPRLAWVAAITPTLLLIGSIAIFVVVLQRTGELTAGGQYRKGVELQMQGEVEGAIAEYDEAIRLGFTYRIVYVNRGVAYYDLGQYDRAVDDLDKAIASVEVRGIEGFELGDAYLDRALAYFKLNKLESAVSDLDEAIRLGVSQPRRDPPAFLGLEGSRTHNWAAAVRTVGIIYRKVYYLPGATLTGPLLRPIHDPGEVSRLLHGFEQAYREGGTAPATPAPAPIRPTPHAPNDALSGA